MEGTAPILHVADARASSEWYAQLGFVVESEHAFGARLAAICAAAARSGVIPKLIVRGRFPSPAPFQECLSIARGAGRIHRHIQGAGMNRQGEAKTIANANSAPAPRDSGTAIARGGDHHPSQVAGGVGDRHRNLPNRHMGARVPASRAKLWRHCRARRLR
jgi:hypothetical protein